MKIIRKLRSLELQVSGSALRVITTSFLALFPPRIWAQDVTPNVVIHWNQAALQGVRDTKPGPPMVARDLAIVHTCIYDAWAAYDGRALGTQLGAGLRRPPAERGISNKNKAISFAAYRAAVDLFPADKTAVFDQLMAQLGYDPNDTSMDTTTPSGIGNVACAAVLNFRHKDGSNQLGTMTASGIPYADYTNYVPANAPSMVPVNPFTVIDVNRWQPLQYQDATGTFVTQKFVGGQWNKVAPFALTSADQFRDQIARWGPADFGSPAFLEECRQLVTLSANLTDRRKMIAEYWADGPKSELPPGHWDLFAQFVSARDHHELDSDVKLFFALTNAIFDCSIVAWDAKRVFDSVRPVTAIPYMFHGQQIRAWGGPFQGTVEIDGAEWIPYQAATFPTPPFPEYISGHSTFSAAGAEILKLFTGCDRLGDSVTFPAGSSKLEPGLTPGQPITLAWKTFKEAANEAGISRRYGGIHFRAADLVGRATGRLVAIQAWMKAESLWSGGFRDHPHHKTLHFLGQCDRRVRRGFARQKADLVCGLTPSECVGYQRHSSPPVEWVKHFLIREQVVVDFGKILAPQTTTMKKTWEAKVAVDGAVSPKDLRSKTLLIAHCTLALSKGSDSHPGTRFTHGREVGS